MCVTTWFLFRCCLAGAFIPLSGATVLLEIVGGMSSFQEGSEVQLLCTISPYNNQMTWYVNNDNYADCFVGSCGLSPNKTYTFMYNFDEVGGKFTLTIESVSSSHANLSFACDDGIDRKTITFQVTKGSTKSAKGLSVKEIAPTVVGCVCVVIYFLQFLILFGLFIEIASVYFSSADMIISITNGKHVCLGRSDDQPFNLKAHNNNSTKKERQLWCIEGVTTADSGIYELRFRETVYRTQLKVISSAVQITTDFKKDMLSKFYPSQSLYPQVDEMKGYIVCNIDLEEERGVYCRMSFFIFGKDMDSLRYTILGGNIRLPSRFKTSDVKSGLKWHGPNITNNSERYITHENFDLEIKEVQRDDAGIYRLYLEETLKHVICLFVIDQEGKPVHTSIIKASGNVDLLSLPTSEKENGKWQMLTSRWETLYHETTKTYRLDLPLRLIKVTDATNYRYITKERISHGARVMINTKQEEEYFDITISEGHALFLHKPFLGNGNVTWKQNDKILGDKKGDFYKDDVKKQDSGTYTCKKENAEEKIKIIVNNTENFALWMALISSIPIFGSIAVYLLYTKVNSERKNKTGSLNRRDKVLIFFLCFPLIGIFLSIINLCSCTGHCGCFILFKRKSEKPPGNQSNKATNKITAL